MKGRSAPARMPRNFLGYTRRVMVRSAPARTPRNFLGDTHRPARRMRLQSRPSRRRQREPDFCLIGQLASVRTYLSELREHTAAKAVYQVS